MAVGASEAKAALAATRTFADQAFSRASGAALVSGNQVRLLEDAAANYPAWLQAIAGAKRYVLFESYIIYDDAIGNQFADALIARAQEGVRVRLLYDWLGAWGAAGARFWRRLRAGGVEVRCYNPPRFDAPFGWLSRDHRKLVSVDGEVAFVSGLCVGQPWLGDPANGVEPWRDTGIEVRGPAVADVERAFADVWAMTGASIAVDELVPREEMPVAGAVSLRIVASVPATSGLFRLNLLVAALARKRLWLTDAYYGALPSYAQALCAAARDGVDVRLLVPGASDLPLLRPVTRAGYRILLAAGVRIFEWNGPMVHAKTAVADARWARVGSTNLNIASWANNCELDVVIEDEAFAQTMEAAYARDITNTTEVVLDARNKIHAERASTKPSRRSPSGSAGRAAAGAVRASNSVAATLTGQRVLSVGTGRVSLVIASALALLATLAILAPRVIAYPLAAVAVWIAITQVVRALRLMTRSPRNERER